jgi:hypothetical protein
MDDHEWSSVEYVVVVVAAVVVGEARKPQQPELGQWRA